MKVTTSSIELPQIPRHAFVVNMGTIGGVVGNGKKKSLTMLGLDGCIQHRFGMSEDFRFPIGVDNDSLWLACDNRLERRTLAGAPISELDFQIELGTRRIGTVAFANDELFIAIERLKPDPEFGLSGELFRMKKNGDLVWGSTLLVDRIEHGRFIQMSDDRLYCVEMFQGSKREAHVVRLLPDGSTEKIGEPLPGYHMSQPLALSDEVFCFWRGNRVWVCDSSSNSLTSVSSTPLHELAYAHAILLGSGKIAIVATQNSHGSESAKSMMVVVESTGGTGR